MNAILYRHPDGQGRVRLDAERQRIEIVNEAEGLRAHAAIGPQGLRELAYSLLELVGEEVHT